MKGKTLKQIVAEITREDISTEEAKDFAYNNFAELYAWIKHNVLINNKQ